MNTKSLGLTLTLAIAVITLGYVSPSFADPGGGKHNHGDGGSGGDKAVATFHVLLMGPVSGESDPDWLRGSSRLVGESDPFNDAGSLNLVVFVGTHFNTVEGTNCFSKHTQPHKHDATDSILNGHVRQRKHGSAEVTLLIDGRTEDDKDDVVYRLSMTSADDTLTSANWLPIKGSGGITIRLTGWEVVVAGNDPQLEPFSCTDAGSFDTPQYVTVTRTD